MEHSPEETGRATVFDLKTGFYRYVDAKPGDSIPIKKSEVVIDFSTDKKLRLETWECDNNEEEIHLFDGQRYVIGFNPWLINRNKLKKFLSEQCAYDW